MMQETLRRCGAALLLAGLAAPVPASCGSPPCT